MAKDDQPSPFRRVMMQWIMWVILGLTVVAAAAVNQFKRQALRPALGELVEFRGVSVVLPGGWAVIPGEADSIIRRHPGSGMLAFTVKPRDPLDMMGLPQVAPGERPRFIGYIDMGGLPERLMMQLARGRDGEPIAVLSVSRSLPRARIVTISILVPGAAGIDDLGPELDLIQRVAASVKIDPDY